MQISINKYLLEDFFVSEERNDFGIKRHQLNAKLEHSSFDRGSGWLPKKYPRK